jgi:ABC-type transport system substrate-binding protein
MVVMLIFSLTLSGCLGGGSSVTRFELTVGMEGQGSVSPKVGKYEYAKATTIELAATPELNWEFSHWIGPVAERKFAKTSVLVDGIKSVTAVFVKIEPLGEPIPVSSGDYITFEQGIALDLSDIVVPIDTTVTVCDVVDDIQLPNGLSPVGAAVSVSFDSTGSLDFSDGVTLRLPLSDQAEATRTGIFHKVDDQWDYQLTTIEDGFAIAKVTSFSTYSVLDAEVVQAVTSAVNEIYPVAEGTEIALHSDTEGAQIYFSTTSPDYPGDFELYETPLIMPNEHFEIHALAVKPNMINSEIRRFRYRPDTITITVVDELGKGFEGVNLSFTDGSGVIQTDSKGIAVFKTTATDTIVVPSLTGYFFEPRALIAEKGDSIEFVASPITVLPLPSSNRELTFNPVVFRDSSRLNPFASLVIREAMNQLIDREFLANEIRGNFQPIVTFIPPGSFEYGFMSDVMAELESKYAYNKAKAQAIIKDEMERMGAELINDRWHYSSKVVELIFIIRSEDERTEIGDYIADQLESIGFAIDRRYMTGSMSSPIWMNGDPYEGLFHLYTGGWTGSRHAIFHGHLLEQMYTSLTMSQALWQAYEPTQELVDAAERMLVQKFDSTQERKDVFATGLRLALQDSVRIWLLSDDQVSD